MFDVRQTIRSMIDDGIRRRSKPFAVADWNGSAVIVAPHPDDETLGCGGVAIKKLKAGADVQFVFVTDGAASHAGRFEPNALRELREAEAVEAVRRLGGSTSQITFLRFPDGRSRDHVGAIADAIVPLLDAWRPESVYVAHSKEPPADHLAANAGVRAALRRHGRTVSMFEYPVWYWYHWPWVRALDNEVGLRGMSLRQTAATMAGLRAVSEFNAFAYVGDVLKEKRHALAAHRSQMERPDGQGDWPILGDISAGEFIARLLADHELFTRTNVDA